MANMDALSILALGLAQSGGGGGGTSDYSDLSNKPQINNVTLSGNKSLSDLGIPTYSAGTGIDITSNAISIDNTVALKTDIPAAELPTIESGDAGKVLKVNAGETGVEWGQAGGSAGAVRYDEAQVLTDAQKNQAKANQELPYMTFVKTASASNISNYAGTGAQQVNLYSTFSNVPSPTIVGGKVYITVSNAAAQFEESIEGTFYDANGHFTLATGDYQYFTSGASNCYLGSSQLVFYKADTSSLGFSGTTYFSVWVDVPTYYNKLSDKFIDSNLLLKAKVNNFTYGDFSTDTGCWSSAAKEDGVVKPSLMSISLGMSTNSTPPVSQYGINLGWSNRRGNNTRPITQIGIENDTNVSGGITIGRYLNTATPYEGSNSTISIMPSSPTLNTVTSSSIVIGQYNDNTAMKVAQLDLPKKWDYSTTYSLDELILCGQNNAAWVFKSLTADNVGHQPPTNSGQSNQYWEWVGESGKLYGYLFTLANGDDEQHRSNALTVDWDGNLVCNNIPACPSADGTYNLQVTISSGVPTYSWVAQV